MKIERVIVLMDGSIHRTKDSAIRRLDNILAADLTTPAEKMAHKNALQIKDYIYENLNSFENYMQILREIKQVKELKDF